MTRQETGPVIHHPSRQSYRTSSCVNDSLASFDVSHLVTFARLLVFIAVPFNLRAHARARENMDSNLLHHVEDPLCLRRTTVGMVVDFTQQTISLPDALVEDGFRDTLIDNAGDDFTLLCPLVAVVCEHIAAKFADEKSIQFRVLEVARSPSDLIGYLAVAGADFWAAACDQEESLAVPLGLGVLFEWLQLLMKFPAVDD